MDRRSLEYYLSLKYPFKIETLSEENGGGFMITYTDLQGCISDGDTIDEVLKNGEDAKKAWLQTAHENSVEIPMPDSALDKYSGRITLRTPKSLHKELVEQAESEGASLNQYIVYLLSKDVSSRSG